MDAALRSKLTDREVMLREYAWLAAMVLFALFGGWRFWDIVNGDGGWTWALLLANVVAGFSATGYHDEYRKERLSRRPDRST